MNRMLRNSTLFALAAALVLALGGPPAAGAADGFKLIVHSSNPATTLSREQVVRYFLKKATTWPSGAAVAPVDQHKESATRDAFSRGVLRKAVSEVVAYWQQQIFSGRGVPPPEKRSDAEIVAFVTEHEGAIGYVSETAAVGDAKVVRIVD
jgi:ABC-type phosphate transport system substrate-binding protein